jgi:methionyl-tRNA formyltransferase
MNIVMLAADTPRTSAYAQALKNAGIRISSIALVKPGERKWGQSSALPSPSVRLKEIFLPDLSISPLQSCKSICEYVQIIEKNTINDPMCVQWLVDCAPSLVIYSGYGGELVQSDLLKCGAPLLHMHAGWLPDYRGSTTVYYSLLIENSVGVSAITLTEEIDSGPIVARKRYPPPPVGLDIDYYYDSAVRADLLVDVISEYMLNGQLSEITLESSDVGRDYYIIHPLLKHIVLSRFN